MKKVIVLGAGMIGSAIAIDLCNEFNVTAADRDKEKLNNLEHSFPLNILEVDLSDGDTIGKIVEEFDLVICAVPGFMGYKTLKSVIKAGKNIVDISFFNEDPFELDELAKHKNITAIVDCGVAPGLSNIILGYHNHRMEISDFECMVGGLPFTRTLPFQYKAPFSPVDVIEEYTRPARIVEDGKIIIKPALSEPESVEIGPVGTLISFNTDGLRSLIKTMQIPNMKEKTLRYPGHIEYMQFLRDTGFFSEDEIEIHGVNVKPVDLAAKILFPQWQLKPGEREFTILKLVIKGIEEGKVTKHFYKLFDEYDVKTETTSMARTTGYTCTSAARLVLNGDFTRKGICPPEYIGEDETCFIKILDMLKERNIKLEHSEY